MDGSVRGGGTALSERWCGVLHCGGGRAEGGGAAVPCV